MSHANTKCEQGVAGDIGRKSVGMGYKTRMESMHSYWISKTKT